MWYLAVAFSLFLLQTALLTWLLVERRKRMRTREELDERLKFETLLSDLSADFTRLQPDEIDRKIAEWLQRLVDLLGVDRGSFLQFNDDGEIIHNTRRSLTHESDFTTNFTTTVISHENPPWYLEQLHRGLTLNYPSWLEQLPSEASGEIEYGRIIGVKSHLAIPVTCGSSVICALTFTTLRFHRTWSSDLIARLHMVGEIFAGVLVRKHAEEGWRRSMVEHQKTEDELRRLTARLLQLQDEERRRIASELHDGLGQSLAIIKNRAMICLRDFSSKERVIEQLEEISLTATSSIDEVREIAHNLRPFELDRLGMIEAIRCMINKVSDSSSIRFSNDLDQIDGLFTPEAETGIYRIVQEGLNNVIKHAEASEARVSVKKFGDEVIITVEDNGKGIDKNVPNSNGKNVCGFGLAGIAERARMLGGSHQINSLPGAGTILTVRLSMVEGVGSRE
jgi:signal transduction histidine kinase